MTKDAIAGNLSTAPKRLLLLKLGAIGDCVMAVPAAYAMHQAGYEVEWICSDTVAPVLRLYPWLRVHAFDEAGLLRGGLVRRLRVLWAIWKTVATHRYTLCATLYYDARYRAMALPVRAERKLALSTSDRRAMLLPGRHHTDEYARILLGVADGERPGQLAPVRAEGLPVSPLAKVPGRHRIVIVPAGAKNALRDDALRRWPVESYAQLAARLIERGDEVILCGGPKDRWASAAFAGLSVTDAIGKLTLVQTLALIESAEVTVTHDTGPLHLAGLTSTGIVAVFGPTDPRGRLPQRENCTALWGGEGFACRPCYDGRSYAPCEHNGCVRQVTVAMVLEEIDLLIRARTGGPAMLPKVIVPEHTPVMVVSPAQIGQVLR
jgi:heptosyltransferase-2